LTDENRPVVFFLTYHGFLTIASSSRIISRDIAQFSEMQFSPQECMLEK
jgi:hypothetical protein